MKATDPLTQKQIHDLMVQALETELGGVEIYRMAILCAKNPELKDEWTKYLGQTQQHVVILRGVFDELGLDPAVTTPGRQIVRDKAKCLLSAMQRALKDAPQAAQLVAAECVVDAETKDHLNWQLLGSLGAHSSGKMKTVLTKAYAAVQEEEAEHLFHTKGWCRELWLESLGLPAVLPPEEEVRDVKTATDAGRAQDTRKPAPKKAGAPKGRSR